jgi:hypothetical protein
VRLTHKDADTYERQAHEQELRQRASVDAASNWGVRRTMVAAPMSFGIELGWGDRAHPFKPYLTIDVAYWRLGIGWFWDSWERFGA